jgi:hypothetical protein
VSSDCSPLSAAAIFAVGALLFGFFFVALRNKREAESLPTHTCRAVPMGLVEVSGRAAGEPFPSPFGGVPCFCSRLVVEEWRKDPKADHWHEIYGKTFSTPFYVEDDTGRVRVNPAEADLHLELDFSFDMVKGLQGTPAALEQLRDSGLDAEGVRERLLQFGAARGGAGLIDEDTLLREHEEPKPRGDLTAQIFARGLTGARLLQDLPRLLMSGKPRLPRGTKPLRMREENLRPGDEVYVLGTASTVNTGSGAEEIVIGRGDIHPWFAIGERSQKETLTRMMGYMWVVPLGGALLILAALSMLADCLGGL